MDSQLNKVLEAREARWHLRNEIANKSGKTVISVTLCVPHLHRTGAEFKGYFKEVNTLFYSYLQSFGVPICAEKVIDGEDGPCHFYCVEGDPLKIKKITCGFEEQNTLFRTLDIDIMAKDGTPIGRADIKKPPRKCFVCDGEAATCVSRKIHSVAEVEKAVSVYLGMIKDIG